jgi:hypothetical protein
MASFGPRFSPAGQPEAGSDGASFHWKELAASFLTLGFSGSGLQSLLRAETQSQQWAESQHVVWECVHQRSFHGTQTQTQTQTQRWIGPSPAVETGMTPMCSIRRVSGPKNVIFELF